MHRRFEGRWQLETSTGCCRHFCQTNSLAPKRAPSYPAFGTRPRDGLQRLGAGTRHSAPGAFEGLPARYWAVMKFIHDEGELTWLNSSRRIPSHWASRVGRAATLDPRFFLHRLPRSRSDHALAAYPFLPNKLAPPASPSTPFLPPVRRRRKQTSTVRAEHAPMPFARSRGIFPLPPHPQSDFAEPPLFTFRADLASAKGFHKRAVGFPQSKAKRGYPRERHGRLLNRGPRTIFDGGRRSKESVSGGR